MRDRSRVIECDASMWGCGGGMDRLVQISTPTGFIEPDNMRPLGTNFRRASAWPALGIHCHMMACGKYGSLNLSSTSDGTGTYKVEVVREHVPRLMAGF